MKLFLFGWNWNPFLEMGFLIPVSFYDYANMQPKNAVMLAFSSFSSIYLCIFSTIVHKVDLDSFIS